MHEENIIEYLEEERAIVYLPIDSIKVELVCTIYQDDKINTVSTTLSNRDIQKAFDDARKNYFEEDDEFILTEKGEEFFKKISNE